VKFLDFEHFPDVFVLSIRSGFPAGKVTTLGIETERERGACGIIGRAGRGRDYASSMAPNTAEVTLPTTLAQQNALRRSL
jgi:hypothetical protein